MTKYLLLSGPPGAGKDTIGGLLVRRPGFTLAKFAAPLRAAAEAFGFDMSDSTKDAPIGPGGMSLRNFQIALSEKFAKPLMGNDVFGLALARRTSMLGGVVVVTDSGFRGEAAALAMEVGAENVRRLHIHRAGHDYSRDSRSDWDGAATGILRIDVVNNGPLDQLRDTVEKVLSGWSDWLVP